MKILIVHSGRQRLSRTLIDPLVVKAILDRSGLSLIARNRFARHGIGQRQISR